MASLVLGIAGAAVGAYFGNPALGFSIGSALGSSLFPTNTTVKGPRLNDLKVQSSSYGKMLPINFGTNRLAGNMIWSTPKIEHRKNNNTGGKGGPTQTSITYSYTASFAIALCEGEIQGIRKIWANGNLIFNAGDSASVTSILASNLNSSNITIYTGTETQLPNSLIQANAGIENTSAYRGTAYIVFQDFQLANYGNSIPNLEFEVVSLGSVSYAVNSYAGIPNPTTNSNLHSAIGSISQFDNPEKIRGIFFTDFNAISATGSRLGIYDIYPNNTTVKFNINDTTIIHLGTFSTSLGIGFSDETSVIVNYSSGNGAYLTYITYEISPLGDIWNQYSITIPSGFSSGVAIYNKLNSSLYFGNQGTANLYLAVIDSVNTYSYPPTLVTTLLGNLYGMDSSDNYLYTLELYSSQISVCRYDKSSYARTVICTGFGTNTQCINVISDNEIYVYDSTVIYEVSTGTRIAAFNTTTAYTSTETSYLANFDNFALIYGQDISSNPANIYFISKSLTRNYDSLSNVVSTLCQRSGLTTDKFDVTALTDNVYGYTISNVASIRSAIEPLMIAYYFDAVESDGKIKFVKRGGASILTIPEDDLAAHEYSSALPDQLFVTRKQEIDLPLETVVSFIDYDASYQVNAQYSRRLITSSRQVNQIQLPIVMTASKAKEISDVTEYVGWQERNGLKAQVGNKYSYLEPTDIITIPKGNVNFIAIISGKNEANGIITLDLVSEDSSTVYTQTQTSVSGQTPSENVNYAGLTNCQLLDIPLLRDQDDGIGFYAAANGYFEGWSGAQLYKSTDGGSSYSIYGDGMLNGAILGATNGILGSWAGGNIFDETNTVSVTIYDGTLSSITELNVLNGSNVAMIGSELIQFRNATLTATNTYTLSGLLRGRRGTDWAYSTHISGERFVLLDASNIYIEYASSSEYNLARYYKAISFGMTDAERFSFTNTGIAQKPLAPVKFSAGTDASNNIVFNWIRQTRISPGWLDGADAPLGEVSESYSLDIYNTIGTSVVRTITSTTNSLTYTNTQQQSDFGGNVFGTIKAAVYQVGAYGRGYGNTKTITLPVTYSVVSLLHFEGTNGSTTFTDEVGNTWTPFGNAQISTAQFQFGAASGLFDGTGDYLQTPSSTNFSANSDFTFECWIRPATVSTLRTIVNKTPVSGTANEYQFYVSAAAKLSIVVYSAGSVTISIVGSTSIVVNTWNHVAFTKNGSTWRVFINGVMDGSAAESAGYGTNSEPLTIGRQTSNSTRDFNGYIDEMRIIKGGAIYTSNFTPPVAPFTYP